jgi:hypothetical protein
MRRPIALLLATVLLGSFPILAKEKNKRKEKRFDPVTISGPAAAEGSYRGITDDQILELRVGSDGKLIATLRENGTSAALRDVTLTGSAFRATQTLPRGQRRTLSGSFMIRTLNGVTAFGLMLEGFDIHLDETTVIERVFFARVSP